MGEQDGELILQRIAVGNHLLVGGDNMDLALAHYVAGLFTEKGISLDPWQSVSLWHRCRQAKEALLSESGPEVQTISVPGRSSRLIGGMVTVEVHRHAVAELLTNGFFPKCELNEGPRKSRTSGFRDLG
ncbi:MAG: Hsp70 family protein, partial [Phycisphaerae bacterium]